MAATSRAMTVLLGNAMLWLCVGMCFPLKNGIVHWAPRTLYALVRRIMFVLYFMCTLVCDGDGFNWIQFRRRCRPYALFP